MITVKPHTPLCQLQEVKVLRHADHGFEDTEDIATVSTQTIDDNKASLPDGISLENPDLATDHSKAVVLV